MARKEDIFDQIAPIFALRPRDNPWRIDAEVSGPVYGPDYDVLAQALQVPVADRSTTQSGRLAKVFDAWVGHELRRAGFDADQVWPRLSRPRVLPQDVALFIDALPAKLRNEVRKRLDDHTPATPSEARILGRAYVKQVDVLISHWARGPELIVSTKTMASSYGKNLGNRFEEAYGDAKNLRGRYPLASIGFLFLMHFSVVHEPAALERAIDMLRKLRAELDVYDTTGLVIADWPTDIAIRDADGINMNEPTTPFARGTSAVSIMTDVVPPDLRADCWLAHLIECVLDRTPVQMHVHVRELREHRTLPISEGEQDPSLP